MENVSVIGGITQQVYEDGLYPSHERIRTRLAKPGYMKAPGVLAVWHETLVELGLENTQS